MDTTTYTTVSYINYNIEVNAFAVNGKNKRLVYTRHIARIDLSTSIAETDNHKIISQLKAAFQQCSDYGVNNNNVFVIMDNMDYYTEKQKISYDLEAEKIIDVNDISKLYELSKNNSQPKEGYCYLDIVDQSFLLNNNPIERTPLNRRAKHITLISEIVFVDFHIYSKLKNLVLAVTPRIHANLVAPLELVNFAKLNANEGVLQLGLNQMSFAINNNDELSTFNVKIGFKNFIEDLYESLESEEIKNAQDLTFLAKNYFPLKTYELNHVVFDSMQMDELVLRTRKIVLGYFEYVFSELVKKGIVMDKYYIVFDEFDELELIELLNENFDAEFVVIDSKFRELSKQQKNCAIALNNFDLRKIITEEGL